MIQEDLPEWPDREDVVWANAWPLAVTIGDVWYRPHDMRAEAQVPLTYIVRWLEKQEKSDDGR